MSGLNLSFVSENSPSPKLFFLGALAGLAKVGARAGIRRHPTTTTHSECSKIENR